MNPLPLPEDSWLDVSFDFATDLPINYQGQDLIMVVTDRFSKKVHISLGLSKKVNPIGVIRLWYRLIFCYLGFPRTIVSNKDIRFTFWLI